MGAVEGEAAGELCTDAAAVAEPITRVSGKNRDEGRTVLATAGREMYRVAVSNNERREESSRAIVWKRHCVISQERVSDEMRKHDDQCRTQLS